MSLFTELKRRNVFRVAAAYLVIGWLVVQVIGVLLPMFDVSESFQRGVVLLLAIGFLPVMLFSWVYEITPEGIKKEKDIQPDRSIALHTAKKLDIITLMAVVGAVGLFAYQQMNPLTTSAVIPVQAGTQSSDDVEMDSRLLGNDGELSTNNGEAKNEVDAASIAVLPFADLSPNKDQEYFSDGIAEEILNVLVRVESLKVASRTSAFGFKGQEALGIPAIAEKLKVRHVLEGSVRKAGDNVRITAQLIDAKTDVHLWSDTFDRPLTTENIFAVQDEISAEIVKALRAELQIEIGEVQSVDINTENLDAYELYLKARQKFFERSTENIPEIIALAKKATELDPNFAQAWASLSAAYSVAPSWGVPGNDHYENAEIAAQKAIAIDPNLALPFAVLQTIEGDKIPINFEKGIEYSNKALSLDSNNSSSLLWRGIDELTLGFFDRADEYFEACLKIDPGYQNCRRWMALSKLYAGDTAAAFKFFDQGVFNNAKAQLAPFYRTLLVSGESQSSLYLFAWFREAYPGFPAEQSYKRWTDPDFDFAESFSEYKANYQLHEGKEFAWADGGLNAVAYLYRQYEHIQARKHTMLWWEKTDPEFVRSPHRKRLIREVGIYDYWRNNEFPPQCRPIGDDDFECD